MRANRVHVVEARVRQLCRICDTNTEQEILLSRPRLRTRLRGSADERRVRRWASCLACGCRMRLAERTDA